jgi:sulfate adenylyltransferase large subunit
MASIPDAVVESASDRFLAQNLNKELLRLTTAGSVDDGKSTLIGRLLHDSKNVYEDQLAAMKTSPINRSSGPIDFSLLTDGLRAEREQGITIDVGYRYFETTRRKFIIADTPGHEQYTRNMATGASTADLAVILVDATKGLLPQTLRHSYIASLLGIPRVVAAVNKMDLLVRQRERFAALEKEFIALANHLGIPHVLCIPISALDGDNVVERSAKMSWYDGPTLLEHLETVPLDRPYSVRTFRFPVQYVIRPDGTFRGFAGQIADGVVHPGDQVVALPSGQRSRIQSIVTFDGSLSRAFSPMSVTLKLEDEIDLGRGDMLVSPGDLPQVSRRLSAAVVWMHTEPLRIGQAYLIKQNTRQLRGKVSAIAHRVNVGTLEPEAADELRMNDIAVIELETSSPLYFDPYRQNRTTGSFILIDPLTNQTLGAGMIRDALAQKASEAVPSPSSQRVTSRERCERHGHEPAIIFLNGRAEFAASLERALFEAGFEVIFIDGEGSSLASHEASLDALYAAGFVILCQDASLPPQAKEAWKAAGHHLFDLSELNLHLDSRKAVAQLLSLLDALRIPRTSQNSREAL